MVYADEKNIIGIYLAYVAWTFHIIVGKLEVPIKNVLFLSWISKTESRNCQKIFFWFELTPILTYLSNLVHNFNSGNFLIPIYTYLLQITCCSMKNSNKTIKLNYIKYSPLCFEFISSFEQLFQLQKQYENEEELIYAPSMIE